MNVHNRHRWHRSREYPEAAMPIHDGVTDRDAERSGGFAAFGYYAVASLR